MVADDGVGEHVVKFYDVSGEPRLVKTFGDKGGIGSGTPGEVTPQKFWALTGCGTDNTGNIYVSLSTAELWESTIRCFTPEGTLKWEVMGLPGCSSSDFVPGTDGREIIGENGWYVMEYTKPAGKQWTLKAYTLNADKYPNDPRNTGGLWSAGVHVRKVKGILCAWMSDMNLNGAIQTFRFNSETDGYTAIPSIHVGSGIAFQPGYCVDDSGNIWHPEGGSISRLPLTGFDAKGDLVYGQKQNFPTPSGPVTGPQRLWYAMSEDVMYIGGYGPEAPADGWGVCPIVTRWDNWSKAPAMKWKFVTPYNNQTAGVTDKTILPSQMSVAGNKVFVGFGCWDDENGSSNPAMQDIGGNIRVYDATTGQLQGKLYGPNHMSSWLDLNATAINAMQRSTGEYLVVREENWKNKQVLFRLETKGEPVTPVRPSQKELADHSPVSLSALHGALRVSIGSRDAYSVTVSDATGAIVLRHAVSGPGTFSLGRSLAQGMYLVRARGAGGGFAEKIIVQPN
jgi:hypothetical protein